MAKKRKKKVKKKSKAKRRKPVRKSRPSVRIKKKRVERALDEGLQETFPGSDAVALTDPTRSIKE